MVQGVHVQRRCRGGAGGAEEVQGRCRGCSGGAAAVQATCTICTSASIISGAGRCRRCRHTSVAESGSRRHISVVHKILLCVVILGVLVWDSVLGPQDLLALLLRRSLKVLVYLGLPDGIPSAPDREN